MRINQVQQYKLGKCRVVLKNPISIFYFHNSHRKNNLRQLQRSYVSAALLNIYNVLTLLLWLNLTWLSYFKRIQRSRLLSKSQEKTLVCILYQLLSILNFSCTPENLISLTLFFYLNLIWLSYFKKVQRNTKYKQRENIELYTVGLTKSKVCKM